MTIKIQPERDNLFSEQGKQLLNRYYSDGKEGVQLALARAANCYSYGDEGLAQRIYDAASKHWFFFSSPVLSNAVDGEWLHEVREKEWREGQWVAQTAWAGPAPKALPIACFLTYLDDTIESQIGIADELSRLSVLGGGTAVHSRVRAVSDKAPGPIPYFKVIDGVMGYFRQGKTRRGSTAIYLDISHPDVLEFINIRTPSGGDSARKIDNRTGVHIAINITREFKNAITNDLDWHLIDPHTKEVRDKIRARDLWEKILDTRAFTGEPYLYFIDVARDAMPEVQKALGLETYGSNLCSEITLATSKYRTAVCCLSSLNLEKYDEWKDTGLVKDLTRFLDNVLQWFIDWAPVELQRAIYSAERERAIGIGTMGFHYWLMKNNIPFEGGGFNSAVQQNNIIFRRIRAEAEQESRNLGRDRGEPADMSGTGKRNSHLIAIAPNANSSVLCNTSPSIEPILSNAYTQKSRAGITLVKNKYLEKRLEVLGRNTEDVWKSIIENNGSVQHLGWMSDLDKKVFKTAFEIDQHWVVQHAEDRQQYVCQSQSLNLFFPPGSDKSYINSVHLKAMYGEKVKSLYYFRTGSELSPDTVKKLDRRPLSNWKEESVCVSCEG